MKIVICKLCKSAEHIKEIKMQIDDLKVKGTLNIVLKDSEGKVKKHKTVRNMVTNHGLAHIIGRMMDAGTEAVPGGYVGNTLPNMMRFMGIGTDQTATIASMNTLETEATTGLPGGYAFRIDMGADRVDAGLPDNPYFSQLDSIYQGEYNAATNRLSQDAGSTAEGIPYIDGGTKKMGDRLVFVAVFQEYNPGGPTATVGIREAAIFNSAYDALDTGHEEQSMLCRTTFDVVNKAPQDSLQITWSVALADAT